MCHIGVLAAAVLTGRILFAGLPVPGAVITASHGERVVTTTSDVDGVFRLSDLDEGGWTVRVQMRGFADATREIAIPFTGEPLTITLTMRSYAEIVGPAGPPAAVPERLDAPDENAIVDADVINGSVVNGAATPFAQPRAFGNNRPRQGAPYSGLISGVFADSAWNARPFSFAGPDLQRPFTGNAQFEFVFGGPLRVPGLIRRGPQMLLTLQHGILNTATSAAAIMPTLAERGGDFSSLQTPVRDPLTGLPFPGGVIPTDRISPQAQALLPHYPLPNAVTARGANYLATTGTKTTQDAFFFGLNTQAGRQTTISGTVTFQRTAADSNNLFGFVDANVQSTLTASGNWQRRIRTRASARLRYQFTQATTTLTPFFAHRVNVSADAGISGNSQAAEDWGPPTLSLPDVAGLSDAAYQHNGTSTHAAGGDFLFKRGRHDVTIGGDLKHIGTGVDQQADPRGTLSFTGAATGVAFADFLLGIPATSTIGFGNPLAHLHGASCDAYVTDDWRLSGLTVNLGARWEYETPFTDTAGYLDGAVHGDPSGLQPRIGASWRPRFGSSLVIKGSYGVYRNLGLYRPLAILLLGQPPAARTFSVQNSAATPLSLADPFPTAVASTATFAVDNGFRPGRVQNWSISVQHDLPGSLTAIASYLGATGAHLVQASLPNSYPPGGTNPCPACPSGYVFVTTGGTSVRNAAQFTIRRRLHNGLTASGQYTLSKSTDDASTFSNTTLSPASLSVAQNWLDLGAERGPSSFDQRHLVTAQIQYTTGVGVTGGTLVDGVWGSIYKDWTVASQLTAGSGLPFTPVSFVAVSGTGFVGIRPQLTGTPLLPAPAGAYANPAAYTTPAPGTWGDAGRNSMRGPAQFGLDASVSRVFRLRGKTSFEWRITATNVLNRVTFSAINTSVSSPQFAQPTQANPMRRIQMTLRYRF
jgi:hypothetical protein